MTHLYKGLLKICYIASEIKTASPQGTAHFIPMCSLFRGSTVVNILSLSTDSNNIVVYYDDGTVERLSTIQHHHLILSLREMSTKDIGTHYNGNCMTSEGFPPQKSHLSLFPTPQSTHQIKYYLALTDSEYVVNL